MVQTEVTEVTGVEQREGDEGAKEGDERDEGDGQLKITILPHVPSNVESSQVRILCSSTSTK